MAHSRQRGNNPASTIVRRGLCRSSSNTFNADRKPLWQLTQADPHVTSPLGHRVCPSQEPAYHLAGTKCMLAHPPCNASVRSHDSVFGFRRSQPCMLGCQDMPFMKHPGAQAVGPVQDATLKADPGITLV